MIKLIKGINYTFFIITIIAGSCIALTLEEVLEAAPYIGEYSDFKKGLAFHCPPEDALVTLKGTTYEISGLRVVGLEGSKTYKHFKDLVQNLKISKNESFTMEPYSQFPGKKFDVFLINHDTPKITIYLALNPLIQKEVE